MARVLVLLVLSVLANNVMAQPCILEFHRVKGAGQKLSDRNNAMPVESVKLKGEQTIQFQNNWFETQGKTSPSGKYFGSHVRRMVNRSNFDKQKNSGYALYVRYNQPAETEKIIYPEGVVEEDGDIVSVTCKEYVSPKISLDESKCTSLKETVSSWLKPDSDFNKSNTNPSFGLKRYEAETNMFSKFKDGTAFNGTNAYLLSLLAELAYEERVEFYTKHFLTGEVERLREKKVEAKQFSSSTFDTNDFICAFQARTEHFFYNPKSTADQKPKYQFFHVKHNQALVGDVKFSHDPEVMVITTDKANILVWRGTDKTYGDGLAEWIFTDFAAQPKTPENIAKGEFKDMKVHAGIWDSFRAIETDPRFELSEYLKEQSRNSKGQKRKLWITGHSLGGGQAIVSGVYLKARGLDVDGVYAFAAPRVLGNEHFRKFIDKNLAGRVHRIEHAQDPITKFYMLGYDTKIGNRYWGQKRDWRATTKEGDSVHLKHPEYLGNNIESWVVTSKPVVEREMFWQARGKTEFEKQQDRDQFDGNMIDPLPSILAGAGGAVAGGLAGLAGGEAMTKAATRNPALAALVGKPAGTALGALGGAALGSLLPAFMSTVWQHNPHFYVAISYAMIPASSRADVPAPLDPYPYTYGKAPFFMGPLAYADGL